MKNLTFISLFLIMTNGLFGQVQFQLDWLEVEQMFQVSIVSNETWQAPYNTTSTAQITLKVPTGSFQITDFINLQEDIDFEANSRHNSPNEAPDFDYISFGLVNIGTQINYTQNNLLPVFKFKNALDCTGEIILISNDDEFMPPNSAKANIGNNITILGAQGNAYIGNVEDGKVDCNFSTNTDNLNLAQFQFEVFPNPVKDDLTIKFESQKELQELEFILFNSTGQVVHRQKNSGISGANLIKMNIENLPQGVYSLEIETDESHEIIDRIVKL